MGGSLLIAYWQKYYILHGVNNMLNRWDNNPLNIRGTMRDNTDWLGEKDSPRNEKNYMGFKHEKYCFRAGYKLLVNYNKFYSINTIDAILHRFAPVGDNNHTANYIKYVADKMGVDTDYKVPKYRYAEMLAYMSDFETGEHGVRSPEKVQGYINEFFG